MRGAAHRRSHGQEQQDASAAAGKNARNWTVTAGRSSPRGWKHFVASAQEGEGCSHTVTRCRSPRGRRLPLAPSLAAQAMGGEPAHPSFGRRSVGGVDCVHFCIPNEFSDSDGCQSLHGAATWCRVLPRTVKTSVDMLYGLFRIDFYTLICFGEIDVVVSQGEVNLSDSERCQTLHIAALWCLSNSRALTSNARPRHGQFFPRDSSAL